MNLEKWCQAAEDNTKAAATASAIILSRDITLVNINARFSRYPLKTIPKKRIRTRSEPRAAIEAFFATKTKPDCTFMREAVDAGSISSMRMREQGRCWSGSVIAAVGPPSRGESSDSGGGRVNETHSLQKSHQGDRSCRLIESPFLLPTWAIQSTEGPAAMTFSRPAWHGDQLDQRKWTDVI